MLCCSVVCQFYASNLLITNFKIYKNNTCQELKVIPFQYKKKGCIITLSRCYALRNSGSCLLFFTLT